MYDATDSACSVGAAPAATAIRDAALVEATTDLGAVLQRYFGFSSFRPLQEQIVADCLAGRDVLALMPTGGGKSLCYQLPALVRPGLTVVVSPLIALMKDQVDFLRGRGIDAAVVNSAQPPAQTQRVLEGLERGAYRLLYVAPERLMQPAFLQRMARWNVSLLAIDEAHCISDWGHDFRPEYRQLREIRSRFPNVPLMALTATATDRVREDIVAQLGLRDAGVYVAGFNRPNLTYRVEPKRAPYQRLLTFLGERRGQSGIVYCFTRRATERLAERLSADGFKAVPYHAGLEQPVRARHQDMFLRDEVQVVCATIAFGMGVNKANIRFVVHYDLPKNIESYYQETGRAGRDGDPAECLMLFSQGDVISHERRIDEKTSAKERDIARKQLRGLVSFAESTDCRRHALLRYFGDTPDAENCGGCDNCLGEAAPTRPVSQRPSPDRRTPTATGPLEDRTEDARRFLACLDDIVSQSRFSVGITHVADVLFGSTSAKVMRFGHEKLKTYGSGKLCSKPEWTHVGKELVRLGYLRQTQDGLPVLSITDSGRALLAGQGSVAIPARVQHSSGEHDAALFERLATAADASCRGAGCAGLRHLHRRRPAADVPRLPDDAGRLSPDQRRRRTEAVRARPRLHARDRGAPQVERPGHLRADGGADARSQAAGRFRVRHAAPLPRWPNGWRHRPRARRQGEHRARPPQRRRGLWGGAASRRLRAARIAVRGRGRLS